MADDPEVTEAEVRANVALVAAKGGRFAEIASTMTELLDAANAADEAPPGVTPIGWGRAARARAAGRLRRFVLAVIHGSANDPDGGTPPAKDGA